MTILADHQINQLANDHQMIAPFIAHQVRELYEHDGTPYKVISYGLSSYGYDARLGPMFKIPRTSEMGTLDPKDPNPMSFDEMNAKYLYTIKPGAFILAHTVEYFKLPANVTGTVYGKSTYARCGINVVCTPLEAGWEGQITLEIVNLSPRPVRLYVGEGICQIQFHQGMPCTVPYDSGRKYQGQTGVTLGRV